MLTFQAGGLRPSRIVVAGDWHGNTAWALKVIWEAKTLLADEEERIILHLGDFGIWPGEAGRDYLWQVSAALDQADATLWFVDGNHEDHSRLALEEYQRVSNEIARPGAGEPGPVPISSGVLGIGAGIHWLPRGYRWIWHGRQWLAMGGAASPDRAIRTEGKTWWPGEEITDEQEREAIEAGHAEVMVTHDCPAGVKHTFPPPPSFWDLKDLARADAHQERLQRIVDVVRPSHLLHGHLHVPYQRICDFGYGDVQVTGLNCDEGKWNYAVLDVRTMEWEASA